MDRIENQNEGYSPYLFYAIFVNTIQKTESLCLFADMEIVLYEETTHPKELALFKQGALGRLLKNQSEQLYETVNACKQCIILRGNVKDDHQLLYLKQAMDVISMLSKQMIAVLDLLSLQWYDKESWNHLVTKEFDLYDHVQILLSQEEGAWLHTRGMLKFGRPDISILHVPKEKIHEMKLLVDQIIYYEALGAMVLKDSKFHTKLGTYVIHPIFYNDFENYDFNNAFIEMKYEEIHKEA